MVRHIVLLRLGEDREPNSTQRLEQELRLISHAIDEVLSFSAGPELVRQDDARGYNWGFVMEFADMPARERYLAHPEHQRVAREHIIPLLATPDSYLRFVYRV